MKFLLFLILCVVAWPVALAWAVYFVGAWVWVLLLLDRCDKAEAAQWHGAHVDNDGRYHP